jgi:hypothetical protein
MGNPTGKKTRKERTSWINLELSMWPPLSGTDDHLTAEYAVLDFGPSDKQMPEHIRTGVEQ